MTGYARPGTGKLVWPDAGKGFPGLQEHWMFYKASLRDLFEVQKGKAAWEDQNRSGDRFNGYKKLMLEVVSNRSGADGAQEGAVLGVMHHISRLPQVSNSGACMCFHVSLYQHVGDCADDISPSWRVHVPEDDWKSTQEVLTHSII